jgi:hypothetical protein
MQQVEIKHQAREVKHLHALEFNGGIEQRNEKTLTVMENGLSHPFRVFIYTQSLGPPTARLVL